MIIQIQEPNIESANLTDWQKIIARSTMQGAGFNFCRFGNMDNDALPPFVLEGSRFEINGAFYLANSNETISLGALNAIQVKKIHFVYAVPNGANCHFEYSRTKPVFNAAKGGWFNGNNRAFLCFWGGDGTVGYFAKTIIGTTGKIGDRVPVGYSEEQDGLPIVNITGFNGTDLDAPTVKYVLEAGEYEIEIAGGGGGGGGSVGGSTGNDGAAGGHWMGIITLFERSEALCMCGGGGLTATWQGAQWGHWSGHGGGGGKSASGETGGVGLGGVSGTSWENTQVLRGHGGGGEDDGTGQRYGGNGASAFANSADSTSTATGGGGGGYGSGGDGGTGWTDSSGLSGGGGGGTVIHINKGMGTPHERILIAGGGGGGRGGFTSFGGDHATMGRNNIDFAAGGGGDGGIANGGSGGNGKIVIRRVYAGG